MKKKYFIIAILTLFLLPLEVFASGGFGVDTTNISMYPGETKTINIVTDNAVGKINIQTSNNNVASVSENSIFIQTPGASQSITITANNVGTTTVSVVASDNFATMDEEILSGETKTITVNVIEKPAPPQEQPLPPSNNNNNSNNNNTSVPNLSKNNNIKSISVEGFDLVKVDNNNYTLTVSNDITSINVNATAEDSKAKIKGTGSHKIQIGENNIEVIVTSESGAQNKINIKVTRKDGYYLEDLDSVLKNATIKEADIIINSDSKISKEYITKIKDSRKILKLNYYDENKKLVYSWTVNGKEIKEAKELITSITYTTENKKEINELSNYADGLYINFNSDGDFIHGTKIKLHVNDKFENESVVQLYRYNNAKKELEKVQSDLKVTDGYIEFSINDSSDYFITMSKIDNIEKKEKSSINIFLISTIIEFIIIIILIIFIVVKSKRNKNSYTEVQTPIEMNDNDINESNIQNYDSTSNLNNQQNNNENQQTYILANNIHYSNNNINNNEVDSVNNNNMYQ